MSWIRKWKNDRKRYKWSHITEACQDIASQIDDQHTPSCIVGLARGGLIPATLLANMLNIREVYSMGLASYDDANKPGEISFYQRMSLNDVNIDRDATVLLVDDISDRGHTFEAAKQTLIDMVGCDIRTAALYTKPLTNHIPTYFHKQLSENRWAVFPWEK